MKSNANLKRACLATALLASLTLGACALVPAGESNSMSFFVTSKNPGKGGDLGGLAGADAYCQQLAQSVGAGGKTWRAYLSVGGAGTPTVDARSRIGQGPWRNAKGEVIAKSVEELHGANNLNKQTALTEKGEIVSGRGDPVNQHDILTGSTAEGRFAVPTAPANDTTCGNWTSSAVGSAVVGHHDRVGLNESAPMKSWNASHGTRGCTIDAFKTTGGAGQFYCFAAR